MSISLDFSDMFVLQDSKRLPCVSRENSLMHALQLEDDENTPPPIPSVSLSHSGDMRTWVTSTLRSMNYDLKEDQLSEESLPIWQKIISEV